jgi:thiol-disulfide isomerase/thioredoxin
MPVYKLEVGQELTYAGESTYEYGDKDNRRTVDDWSDWTIWVSRENDDGSWRLIVKYATARREEAEDPDVTLAYLDLSPDGSFEDNPSFGYRFNPHVLFAKLPVNDEEIQNGWQSHSSHSDTTYVYASSEDPAEPSVKWSFEREADGIQNRVYMWTTKSRIEFARSRGVVGRVTSRTRQDWGLKGEGEDETKLLNITQRDVDWIKNLDSEYERYQQTSEQYTELISKLEQSVDEAEDRLAQSRQLWADLVEELKNDEVRTAAEARLASHDGYAKYQLEEAQRLADKVGQPAPDWDTVDLAGESRKLEEYRGKVMVLDFWYRGCGWCIRAMPQIKELVDDFAGQDVAVLGMNTDSELEDALFVEKALQLNYPSVRIDNDLPEEYGVSGFPTLVIVDREGTIRDFHVGYSPTLREEVGESVRDLLSE